MRRAALIAVVGLAGCGIPNFVFDNPPASSPPPGAPGATDGAIDGAPDAPPAVIGGQSCLHLPATCGTNANENCCAHPTVLGGKYFRGFDVAGDPNSGDRSLPATVSTYELDKFEVTVGRFRAFVTAGQGTALSPPAPGAGAHAAIANSGWNASWPLPADADALNADLHCAQGSGGDLGGGSYYLLGDAKDPQAPPDPSIGEVRPMNCVSWYEAMAFCIWDGGYLPTEAEWGLAATTTDQRPYPWSNVHDAAHMMDIDDTFVIGSFPSDDMCRSDPAKDVTCNVLDLLPVGSRPLGQGLFGHMDLAGSLDEWMLDATQNDHATRLMPCTDCAQVSPSPQRIIRGGSVSGAPVKQRTGLILPDEPVDRSRILGFRCARPAGAP